MKNYLADEMTEFSQNLYIQILLRKFAEDQNKELANHVELSSYLNVLRVLEGTN